MGLMFDKNQICHALLSLKKGEIHIHPDQYKTKTIICMGLMCYIDSFKIYPCVQAVFGPPPPPNKPV